jgi:hypothetical protein
MRSGRLALLGSALLVPYVVGARWLGVDANAISGFVGVLVGSCIVMFAQSSNSALERRQRMQLAALDRRLEAHQSAFRLWRKLLGAVHDRDRIGSVVIECQEFWESNCLYLDAEVRKAFAIAYSAANDHGMLLSGPRTEGSKQTIMENWKTVTDAGNKILAAVDLPPLSGQERDALERLQKPGSQWPSQGSG